MADQTQSEILFEKFCGDAKIECVSVPRETNLKTPDYDLIFGTLKVVAEVKEIDRNDEEKESDRMLELRGYGNATGGLPGQRVRLKIQSSSPQIKSRAQGIHPGLLVLYEQHYAGQNIHPYHIMVAMYGLETVVFAVPETDAPYLIDNKLGPKRKMTPNANTSISAVATLHQHHTGAMKFIVYHNKYAAIPLAASVLASYPVVQFRIGEAELGSLPQWEAIV
jgi:hypothetical protein